MLIDDEEGSMFVNALGKAVFLMLLCVLTAAAQPTAKGSGVSKPVMWEAGDIRARDLFHGPGGVAMMPDLEGATLIRQETGGNNLKYRIKDKAGNEWVAKIADESQPETAAVRLLWGIGYKTEVNYNVPKFSVRGVRRYSNVRVEARPKDWKRAGNWSWANNPFVGTNEFEGLKIMMAMFNNWDLKDENNAILVTSDGHHYIISDLGASFGRLAKAPQSRSGRSVNKPEHYADSVFIKDARGGVIQFAYTGMADHLLKGIKVEHGRWLADLLLQLTDKQIKDAFRAANYSDENAALLTDAFKARIDELDRATRSTAAMR